MLACGRSSRRGGRHDGGGGLEEVLANFGRQLDLSRAAAERGESVRDLIHDAFNLSSADATSDSAFDSDACPGP